MRGMFVVCGQSSAFLGPNESATSCQLVNATPSTTRWRSFRRSDRRWVTPTPVRCREWFNCEGSVPALAEAHGVACTGRSGTRSSSPLSPPEAQQDPRAFKRACHEAMKRLSELEE